MAGGKSDRFFTIDIASTNKTGGRYNSATPMSAACKAARRIFREASSSHVTSIRFILRETTRATGSSNKRHFYSATRHASNRTFVKAGKTFKVEFDVDVKCVDEDHVKDLLHKLK
jgi:hypothetical protein